MPCYNVEAYAASTLLSLARSRHPDIEFILVDDASTDTTPALLAERADRLGQVTVLTHQRNAGLAAARNTGLDAARGTYLAFLDGDDWVEPGYYPKLLAAIERLGCEMVRTDHVKVHGRKRTVYRISHGPRGVVMSPRAAILPADRLTSVDSPWTPGPGSTTAAGRRRSAAFAEAAHGRGPAVDLAAAPAGADLRRRRVDRVFYRRGVATSLTQRSATSGSWTSSTPSSRSLPSWPTTATAPAFLPKAVRSYCTVDRPPSEPAGPADLQPEHASGGAQPCVAAQAACRRGVGGGVQAWTEARRQRLRTVLPG